MDWILELDTSVFLALNGLHSPFWDLIMAWISAKLVWIPLYMLLIFMFYRNYQKNIWIILLFAAITVFLTDQTSVELFKNVFERLRPCHNPELEGLVHTVNGKCGGQYGFISSHATNTFGIAAFTIFFLGKRYRYFTVLMIFWAVLVSYSRIYLGVHYPLDVLCGALWGSFIGFLTARFAGRLMKNK